MAASLSSACTSLSRAIDAVTDANDRLQESLLLIRAARPASEELQEEAAVQMLIENGNRSRTGSSISLWLGGPTAEMLANELYGQCSGPETVGSDRSVSVRPVYDLSSLPRVIDPEGDTVRGTSSDGLSYAGTVVRGGIGVSNASSSYHATSEQLPFQWWVLWRWLCTSMVCLIAIRKELGEYFPLSFLFLFAMTTRGTLCGLSSWSKMGREGTWQRIQTAVGPRRAGGIFQLSPGGEAWWWFWYE